MTSIAEEHEGHVGGELDVTCVGDPPLEARWEPWMVTLLADPARCAELVAQYGSPLHVHNVAPFERNIHELRDAARRSGVDFEIFFARKANKCLSYVHAAARAGIGVDVASHEELRQTLDARIEPERIIVTAAVKPLPLLELAISSGVAIAVDNDDEAERIGAIAAQQRRTARVVIRLAFRDRRSSQLSRFGYTVEDAAAAVRRWSCRSPHVLAVEGLHFHLDGYAAEDRVHALDAAIELADDLRSAGLASMRFIDIGGGFPVSYLKDARQWSAFWDELRAAVGGRRSAITYRGHGYGLHQVDGQVVGSQLAYPHAQAPTGADWLRSILDSPLPTRGEKVALALEKRSIRLHCEPGRALLDGCGMTLARVEHRKQVDGDVMVGLSMNSTNCRSQKSELMADPRLVRHERRASAVPAAGYLAGAYCSEGDMIMRRRLLFPDGVEVGDLVAFPNTAGYLMHFTESRSHQFPLPLNVDISNGPAVLDACDDPHASTIGAT